MNNSKQLATKNAELAKDYQSLLNELKGILNKGLHTAYKAVDNIKVQTYWQVGERIVREELGHKDRSDYGEYLIPKLSNFRYRNCMHVTNIFRKNQYFS